MSRRFNYNAVVELYKLGYTVKDVATIFDSTASYVTRILKKEEIELRPVSMVKVPVSYGRFSLELQTAIDEVGGGASLRMAKISGIYKNLYLGFQEGKVIENKSRDTKIGKRKKAQ
ncbi:hypothetical protein FT641_17815 [Bacillus paranthracis]|uniref:hypothetical protein n=1 Tax=Bacillus paranthracis TaxID=2026186 RepID=UPI0018798ED9|nr:hypothetical protein [Bacillus paranthracis]MBE7114582.1 hypothetical protein [Bacillus paranthracis]MBE7154544.1 hypothetical protein [Bacillus paranthracis]